MNLTRHIYLKRHAAKLIRDNMTFFRYMHNLIGKKLCIFITYYYYFEGNLLFFGQEISFLTINYVSLL